MNTSPLLLTATLLALLCAAAAQAQDNQGSAPWAALLGLRETPCVGKMLPTKQRKEFMQLKREHEDLRRKLGRELYTRQLEYDVYSRSPQRQKDLDELADAMQRLRQKLVHEDQRFCSVVQERFGLDISKNLHCVPMDAISAEK